MRDDSKFTRNLGCIGCVLLWYLLGLPGTGMELAYVEHKYKMASSSCRESMGFAYGLALGGPFTTGIAFFMTGFAEHGFQFQCKESSKQSPDADKKR